MRRPTLKTVIVLVAAVTAVAISSSVAKAQPPITEFPVPTTSSTPTTIVVGPDGNLWFTEQGADKIGRITPTGVVTEFTVPPPGSFPVGIAAGPDGNLWFTLAVGNRIGLITPAGVITEFPVTTPGNLNRIAAGPDGNLWFAEASANKIGQITPAGVVTEFPIPTVTSQPFGITAGPDGNLWFTEFGGNKIGQITPAGVITEFLIPTVTSQPYGITAGPDGNLWFTEYGGNKIGQITPAGVIINEFPIPTGASQPVGITVGPDGNLWFTEFAKDKIGRITPAGVITEFPLTPNSAPGGITAGPEGNLWFAEESLDNIGRLRLVPFGLTVTLAGAGHGAVSSAPGGLECPPTCAAGFPTGTTVTLTATVTAGSVFGGWSGGGCSGTGPCVVPVTADIGVIATFDAGPPPAATLTVSKAGTGDGTVTGPGIECGTQCTTSFNSGLTLTAAAGPGSSFGGWSGPCGGTGLCVVGTGGDTTVTATFVRLLPQTAAETAGGNGPSAHPSVSADGRLLGFDSAATNLAAACSTGGSQVFVRDRVSGITTCLSVAPGGGAGNGASTHPTVGGDGQIVAFDSMAKNLGSPCTSGVSQIFVADRGTGQLTCVSVAGGQPGDDASTGPVISADGRLVAFTSTAKNLAGVCAIGVAQIFVFDRTSGQLTCVSAVGGLAGNGPSGHPALSEDGRLVAFHSAATNLAAPCVGAGQQIFVLDRTTGVITCESLDPGGAPGNGQSANPALDAAGSYLAYESLAKNLASPCTTGISQVFVRDRITGLTRCLSVDAGGAAGTGASRTPALSGDGRRLVFVSAAPNIVSAVSLTAHGPRQGGDTDQVVGEGLDAPGAVSGPSGSSPEVISTSSTGETGSAPSDAPTVSGDGSVTGFQSTAPNLAPGTTGTGDVFTVQSGRARLTTPAPGSQFVLDTGPTVTFSWTPLPGVSLYGFEFTGPNRQFSNPNGDVPDPVNGFGGAGGGFPLTGTSFSVLLGPGLPVGSYQVRVLGVTSGGTFSDALTIVLGAGNRPVVLSPADQATLTVGSAVTFGWTPVAGAAFYGFEFTGANRTFANPNGAGPDPVNGFGGAGGALVLPATGFSLTLPAGITPGSYQIRAIGLSASIQPVGVFSDAITFVIP